LSSMLPTAFGSQKKKTASSDIFSKTRRKDESVSALTLDPAGARLITGSYDYDVKFWDFAGMDSTFRPFRTIKPCGDHQIHHLEYSLSGDQFLIISGTAQAKLYDRDGFEIIWDVENKRKQKHVLVHKSKERGGRSAITAACYSLDSKFLAGAAQDGSLFLWGANGPYTRPSHMIEKAHQSHSETSSIIFSRNNWSMVTRGGDDCVKVWDVRNFKSAVAQAKELTSFNAETNVTFSPDERMIITGTATKKGEGYGKLVMMDRESLEIVRTMSITKSSVIRVLWHSRINQVVTGSADGLVHVFYDPAISVRGAKLCVVKEPKRRAIDDYEINRPIIAPHSLSMFRDDRPKSTKRKREKLRKDPVASRRPDLPVNGPGKGGKIGSSLTQHIMKELIKDTTRDEDPREALLKFAEISKSDPQWIGNGDRELLVHGPIQINNFCIPAPSPWKENVKFLRRETAKKSWTNREKMEAKLLVRYVSQSPRRAIEPDPSFLSGPDRKA
ncbi:41787_t:CDS:10, partial [Gigaspora margarita]